MSPSELVSSGMRKDLFGIDGYLIPCTSALDKPF